MSECEMLPQVVNRHFYRGPGVDIGRQWQAHHFGNPFSHSAGTLATVHVLSREQAINRFSTWLDGTTDQDVEPERRAWILANEADLEKSKFLICYCKPKACHGDVYVERIVSRQKETL